jgi:TolB-like protein
VHNGRPTVCPAFLTALCGFSSLLPLINQTSLSMKTVISMKTIKQMCFLLFLTLVMGLLLSGIFNKTFAQGTIPARQTITVLNIDTKGISLDPQQMGNLVRIELEKLDTFDVTDRYDVVYLVEKNKLNIASCYGKMCLLEVGNTIHSDYMFTGSAELYGQTIVITFRLVDVAKGSVERTTVMEFLNLPLEVQSMTGITINRMFGRQVDEQLLIRLTRKYDYENAINNPHRSRLNLQGPRFGYSFIFGEQAKRLGQSRSEGGFEAYPSMFQFGYQFEKQYLNEGNCQALFEFIPMISGVDQQMFVPSLTILNGFRNTKYGWEIAIGPSIGIGTYSELAVYNGRYYTKREMDRMGITGYTTEKHLDSRGDADVTSALVIAFGKTFKSGKMNIPVNIWGSVPTHEGFRLGVSVGYNSKK